MVVSLGEEQLVLCGLCILVGIVVYGITFFLSKKESQTEAGDSASENKMYEEKINFLTNISHELRTPLLR